MKIKMKPQYLSFVYGVVIFIVWYLSAWQWSPRCNNTTKPEVRHSKTTEITETGEEIEFNTESFSEAVQNPNFKYILQWTKPVKEPYTFMKVGQDVFVERRCSVNNCFVTWNKTYLSDIANYDAILFYDHDIKYGFIRLPKERSAHQKYVFVSPEPAKYYPVMDPKSEGFFNLTWTYKLDSDLFYGYILVKDKTGDIIGPKIVMHWPKVYEMKPIDPELIKKLSSKKRAVAWFVSKCRTRSGREQVAMQIMAELVRYNMTLDIYGSCGSNNCPSTEASCWQMLETDYYFYLSFEDVISEDYVSEQLLHALQHNTVPIVYGGANYTRFMPDGIYLNARTLFVPELVKKMVDLIHKKEDYYNYFRWHNHYNYYSAGDSPDTDYYCNLCKKINDADSVN